METKETFSEIPNTILKCIAIDDESLALDLVEDNIAKVPFLKLEARCRNAFEAIEYLQNNTVDLIFLDIQMPGLTGVQFLEGLTQKPMVIFVTAYQQYALEGFNLDVIDYVLKPISFERFLKASHKALDYFKSKLALQGNIVKADAKVDYIFIHADYSLMKIMLEDILYIEGLKDYIKIHVRNQKYPIVCRMTMKLISEKLPSDEFLRIHKSFIVSLKKIESIRNQKVKIGENHIPLSDSYSEQFYQTIGYQKE
ncbi:LytR/AlgR family response regulator transcription factor [Aquirufa echingensis]|jgi:DNA-binding LytR/AlgR family response regulator|uniref:LytTR family DNA-binding domain-containing protein n=1 Tax=Aquirufa echingensis TaxID=3096516 RepID=A0ABW6CZG6_9BACT